MPNNNIEVSHKDTVSINVTKSLWLIFDLSLNNL
jgi:hypothetical protein